MNNLLWIEFLFTQVSQKYTEFTALPRVADVEGRWTPGTQRSEAAERRSFSPAQPRGGSRNASLKDGDWSIGDPKVLKFLR